MNIACEQATMNMEPKANFYPKHARYAWASFSRGGWKAVSIHVEHPKHRKNSHEDLLTTSELMKNANGNNWMNKEMTAKIKYALLLTEHGEQHCQEKLVSDLLKTFGLNVAVRPP